LQRVGMLRPNEILEDREGVLHIDGVSALELAERFDTPLYVMSERRIRNNYRRVYETFSKRYRKVKVYYSAKANTNLSILKILEEEGSCLDAVSPGEVFLALKAGFKPERILYTGTSVRDDELRFLSESGVTINVDSLSQLRRLLKISTPETISVRVNPEVGAGHHEHVVTAGRESKFGIWEEKVVEAYRTALEAGVKHFGIQMHIGSGILSVEPFTVATENLLKIANRVHEEVGIGFEFIDLGGGLGVPYKPEEEELNLDLLAEKVTALYRERVEQYGLGEPTLCVEPGRYIVCDAGVLLTRVNTVKVTPFKRFVGVDAGFNTLIRPAMYGSYHPVVVANRLNEPGEETYTIVGPICESGDILAKDRMLPRIQEGDLIAVLNAGAYGYSMSSQYNSRPRCAEVLVMDGEYALIRERETLHSLLEGQHYPPWLK